MSPTAASTLSMPARPEPARPHSFPLLASIAPVVGSVAIWAVTHSAFSLVFAFLGPVVALGSLLDAKRTGRRTARSEQSRFDSDVAATLSAIEHAQERERLQLSARAPAPLRILASPERDPERWRGSLTAEVPVHLGRGSLPSGVVLAGDLSTPSRGRDHRVDAAFGVLRARAATLQDAPVIVDARLGIGVCGPPARAAAIARGLLLQLANALSPQDATVCFSAGEAWLATLPHTTSRQESEAFASFTGVDASTGMPSAVMIAVADSVEDLPRGCRVVVDVSAQACILRHPDPGRLGPLRTEAVSREQALAYAEVLRRCAQAEGLGRSDRQLPELVRLGALAQPPGAGRSSLECSIARSVDRVITLDLVRDGPHAVVGGTTGSGKSELLVSWVLGMALGHGPAELNFLLVDFKGGSAFAAVERLPHCVGLITDLDEASAARALASLRAELRYRERVLAGARVRAIDELDDHTSLPRLVIVVDEFAAMVADFPELHALFADVAARGRSLGVHLILCTQRPAGVVRDSVLANCALRLSLRVNNVADSVAVIGSDAAARLGRLPLGRGLLGVAGAEPELLQIALAEAGDAERACTAWPRIPLRRPWCDPLPTVIGPGDLDAAARVADSGDGIAFGLVDLPEEQRQTVARYDPGRDGNLVVLGGHGSGKTGVLAALASSAHAIQWVPSEIDGAWDLLHRMLAEVRAAGAAPAAVGRRILLLDDADVLLSRFAEDYQPAFVEALTGLVREGGGSGVHLVISAQRIPAALQAVSVLCDSRLLLRLPDRQEHVLAGGRSEDYVPAAPPGAALWRGHRMQVMTAPTRRGAAPGEVARLSLHDLPALAVVSTRPRTLAEQLRAQTPSAAAVVDLAGVPGADLEVGDAGAGLASVFIADPDTWQSRWGLLAAARTSMPVLFDRCSVSDFRSITRVRGLPPPISAAAPAQWLLEVDGSVRRVLL